MLKKNVAIRLAKYIVTNSIFVYAVYAGVIQGDAGWENIVKFLISALFVVGVLMIIGRNVESVLVAYNENNNRIIPLWFDGILDLVVGGVLIYHNWLFMGTMYLFTSFAIRVLDANAKEYMLKCLKE